MKSFVKWILLFIAPYLLKLHFYYLRLKYGPLPEEAGGRMMRIITYDHTGNVFGIYVPKDELCSPKQISLVSHTNSVYPLTPPPLPGAKTSFTPHDFDASKIIVYDTLSDDTIQYTGNENVEV